jgi:hypothetical protein
MTTQLPITEANVRKDIVDHLKLMGFIEITEWKGTHAQLLGVLQQAQGFFWRNIESRISRPGIPDLQFVDKKGLGSIEIKRPAGPDKSGRKRPAGKLSEKQQFFACACDVFNLRHIVAYSVDDVMEIV